MSLYYSLKKKLITFLSLENLSALLCLILALLFLIFPQQTIAFSHLLTASAIEHFDTLFLRACSVIVILAGCLAISPVGRITLGDNKKQPRFSLPTWIAMLFAAGMGSGLVFWGIAEPVYHQAYTPKIGPDFTSTADVALSLTYFHWGIHAWSIYAVVGLSMAWFSYNKNCPMTISACFGAHTTFWGRSIDAFAVLAVIFGVAGTLANSLILIQTGVEHSLNTEISTIHFQVILLLVIATLFTLSSALGIKKGIAHLSRFNLILFLSLLVGLCYIAGLQNVVQVAINSSYTYLKLLPELSWFIAPEAVNWSHDWSINYFIWWIAWAPFVGAFIAMISQGRTIRQFLLIGIIAPTLTSILWFSAFSSGIQTQHLFMEVLQGINVNYTQGIFTFFDAIPAGNIFAIGSMILLITFVITSADSAIYVSHILLQETEKEKTYQKFLWGFILIAISLALLYEQNLELNRHMAILGAIPYCFVMIAQITSCVTSLCRHQLHLKNK